MGGSFDPAHKGHLAISKEAYKRFNLKSVIWAITNHNPFKKGDNLVDYLDEYHHGTLVLNIKETGIETTVLEEVQKRNIKSYFLLDVEMPYLIKAFIKNEKNLAVRFSEYEPIENVVIFKNNFNWIRQLKLL